MPAAILNQRDEIAMVSSSYDERRDYIFWRALDDEKSLPTRREQKLVSRRRRKQYASQQRITRRPYRLRHPRNSERLDVYPS